MRGCWLKWSENLVVADSQRLTRGHIWHPIFTPSNKIVYLAIETRVTGCQNSMTLIHCDEVKIAGDNHTRHWEVTSFLMIKYHRLFGNIAWPLIRCSFERRLIDRFLICLWSFVWCLLTGCYPSGISHVSRSPKLNFARGCSYNITYTLHVGP